MTDRRSDMEYCTEEDLIGRGFRRGPLDDIEAILPVGEALIILGVAFIAGFVAGLATAWVL